MNKIIVINFLVCILTISIYPAFCNEKKTPVKLTQYQKLWEKLFKEITKNKVLDDVEIIDMDLFRAFKGIRPMTAAMASILTKTAHTDALTGALSPALIKRRAIQLKGSVLSSEEEAKLMGLYGKIINDYRSRHPELKDNKVVLGITFGIRDVRFFEKSILDCKIPEEAIARIRMLHGYDVTIEKIAQPTLEIIQKSIDTGVPVLLQNGEKWHVLYGYNTNNVIYNIPEITPLVKGPETLEDYIRLRKNSITTKEDYDRAVRRVNGERLMGITTTNDYNTLPELPIPGNDSVIIEPFEEGKFTAYLLHSGKPSAEGLDKEILAILNIDNLPAQNDLAMTGNLSVDLWNKYFYRKKMKVLSKSNVVEGAAIQSNKDLKSIFAALASIIIATDSTLPLQSGFKSWLFYEIARRDIKKAKLTIDETKKITPLIEQAEKSAPEFWERYSKHPWWNRAAFLQEICGSKDKPSDVLYTISRKLGWDATIEGGSTQSWNKYQESIDKQIPILLKDRKNEQWRICYGYVEVEKNSDKEEEKKYLLICDPTLITGLDILLNSSSPFPITGFWFEEFKQEHYTPYFIHGWDTTAKAWFTDIKKALDSINKKTNL